MANNTGKKFGGREAGTPNKITKSLKEALKAILENEIKSIPDHLERLDSKDRLEIIIKLMPYVIPKENEIETEILDISPPNISFVL